MVGYRSLRCGRCNAGIGGLAAIAAFALWSPCFGLAWGTNNEALTDDIVEMLTIKSGSTVAEIGAGNGAMAVRIAKKVGPAGRVFADRNRAPCQTNPGAHPKGGPQ